jgi:hypothetical protein
MGLQYVSDLEEQNKEELREPGEMCWGVTGTW